MVTTRSAERAALQGQELALRTRNVEASPSVNASKRKSSNHAPLNSDNSQLQSDIEAGSNVKNIVHDTSHLLAESEEEDDSTIRVNINVNKLKRIASEEPEEDNLQNDIDQITEQNLQRDSQLDESVSDDEDDAPEVVSTRPRTPKRKPRSDRTSASRKKAKLDAHIDNEDSGVLVTPRSQTSSGLRENESDTLGIIQADEQAATESTLPSTTHGPEGVEVQKVPGKLPLSTTAPDLSLNGADQHSYQEEDIQSASESELNSDPLAQSTPVQINYTPQTQTQTQSPSSQRRIYNTSRSQQSEPDQTHVSSTSKNLPPKPSSSKSTFQKRIMHNRQKFAQRFGTGFKMTSNWLGKRRHFTSTTASAR